jgi:hypothetical protein
MCLLPIGLVMEAASTFETSSVNFYQTTQRNNPEDRQVHTCHRENTKPHMKTAMFAETSDSS